MRAALVLLVACSSPPAAPRIDNATRPALPGPRVVRGGLYGLTVERMPAIAPDGSRVVAAFRESDGDRGMPNLTLVVKDRRDAELARHVVLSIAEADAFLDDADGNNPRLDERIARANTWLAQTTFEPMLVLEPEATDHPADRKRAARGPLAARWEPHRLRISDGPTVLVDRDTPHDWVPQNVTVGTNVCLRSPYLGGAAVERDRRLAVVTISTVTDSDFCLPATDSHHVVVW